jgi:hypothetical protein
MTLSKRSRRFAEIRTNGEPIHTRDTTLLTTSTGRSMLRDASYARRKRKHRSRRMTTA